MTKKSFMKKLSLNKLTITNLENRAMDFARGGRTVTCWETCLPKCDTYYTCWGCPVETNHYDSCAPCIP